MQWENGKYALVDGIFGEVVRKRGNIIKMRKIAGKEFYVVTDGNGKYSHGDTLKEAREDLIFKIDNRRKSDFEHLTIGSVMSYADAVVCYRVITGACSFGVKDFVKTVLGGKPKSKYKVSEIIEVTAGHYGADTFKAFFDGMQR